MKTCIKIEYLAANAIIELLKKDEEPRVSFEKLKNYGINVIKSLKESREIFFIFDVNTLGNIFNDYSEYFKKEKIAEIEYITLKSGKTIKELENHFINYLPSDIYNAFVDVDNINKLLA